MRNLLSVAGAAFAISLITGCGQPAKSSADGSCTPKTCDEEGWECGSPDDGCGHSLSCGTCSAPLICGAGTNPYGCAPCRAETTAAFCARYERNCGPFTGENLCGASRSVNCGGCSNGMTCGGGGIEGRCGTPACQPESDLELCATFKRTCGPLTTADKCQQQRTVDCGVCPDAAVLPPGPDAAQPAGLDASLIPPDAAFVDPPDAAFVEPPDADVVVAGLDASAPLEYDAGSQACAAQSTKAKQLPLDIYMMLDQSISMNGKVGTTTQTYWQAVTAAIDAFLSQPQTDVSVGIQYFGIPHTNPTGACYAYYCATNADCYTGCGTCSSGYCNGYTYWSDTCVSADYATPDVEIAPLPGVATAIRNSIKRHGPNSLTPTAPALQGAIDHARAWANAHPGHVVIDIFATDGMPSTCPPTDETGVNAIAASGAAGTPKVLTFVIGVGSSLTSLNGLAAAGGTTKAYLVDTGANVTQQMLAALNTIRGTALGCSYTIPPPTTGTTLDLTKVNVQYTPGNGSSAIVFPQVLAAANCPAGADGWHYDSGTNPTQIVLCGTTCQKVQADSSGQVDILVGCATQHCPPTVQCGYGF
ncbi:MAG: hypothetical protein QM765_49635 [Myxococcales bacterium]